MGSKAQKLKGYPLPETIEPEATQSFCVIIPEGEEYRNAMFEQLRVLGKWWNWKRDEDRPTAASETALVWRSTLEINENCEGDFPVTPQELEDAISNGMYKAVNNVAKQIVSGRTFNIGVDADGNVTDPSTVEGGGIIPEDDPATVIDETRAAKMGGVISQLKQIERFFDKLDNYYGATNGTPATSQGLTYDSMLLLFSLDPAAFNTALTGYYTYRGQNPRFLFDGTDTQENVMFCLGGGKQAWNTVLVENTGFTGEKLQRMADLSNCLLDEFWDNAYNTGTAVPSSQYLDASCVPVQTSEFFNVPFSSSRSTVTQKAFHRVRVTIEGRSVDAEGDIQDAFWFVNGTTGVRTRTNPTFNHLFNIGNLGDSQVPYNALGKYQFTLDLTNATNSQLVITMNKNAAHAGTPSPNFYIKVEDLGEI